MPIQTPASSGPMPVRELPRGRSSQVGACVDLAGVKQFLDGLLHLGATVEVLTVTPIGVAQVMNESRVVGANGDPAGQSRQVPVFAVVAVVRT